MGKTIDLYGFPNLVSADVVLTFLERYTGVGSIEALEVKQKNADERAYARVQFRTDDHVEYILPMVNNRKLLWYDKSYFMARKMDFDLVKKPRQYACEMECTTLHFGCQVSTESLSVLCKMKNASVKFGSELRKLYFGVPWSTTSYKLQLAYENIWQVQLHCPRGVAARFLVIQLYGAPRIYQKVEDNPYNYYREHSDDQWVRATDFTPSFAIGQSSHLCIEIPHNVELPDLSSFPNYKESNHPFNLVTGYSFSKNMDLVPMVGPTQGYNLPFNIVFKICALVQHGCIPGPVLDDDFFALLDPQKHAIESIEYVMKKLYLLKDCCYDPVRFITQEYQNNKKLRSPAISLDPGLVYVRRVQITPSKVYFWGPEVNVSNRVLRHYADYIDNFLRVSFVDEELENVYATEIILKSMCKWGKKNWKRFVPWFNMVAFRDLSMMTISLRILEGDFSSLRNVAKYAARLGQSFGSSKKVFVLHGMKWKKFPDIEVVRNGTKYVFSDGIGKISSELAERVSRKCGYNFVPSAFQIRYAGYKGVVAVDPTSFVKLSLRKSMCKFESDNTKLDILLISKYQACYLNRQIITLLSTLGVSDHVFEKKQRDAVCLLDAFSGPNEGRRGARFNVPRRKHKRYKGNAFKWI
ncbi:putative RNA-directed RNA polymerase [Helianthus annuus]|nr:putative RNA-directed RNA polymerase [Helianthus annuus]